MARLALVLSASLLVVAIVLTRQHAPRQWQQSSMGAVAQLAFSEEICMSCILAASY